MTTVIEFYISEKDRKNAIKKLSEYINPPYSKKIEEGIYDFTHQYCISNNNNLIMASSIYKDSLENLVFNFEQNNKTIQNIKEMIIKKKYNAYNLAFLRPEELDEENWRKIILRKNTTEDKLSNLPAVEWKPCRTCKGTEYFYRQEQTRSADEPMTTFYTCKKCDRTYKVNN